MAVCFRCGCAEQSQVLVGTEHQHASPFDDHPGAVMRRNLRLEEVEILLLERPHSPIQQFVVFQQTGLRRRFHRHRCGRRGGWRIDVAGRRCRSRGGHRQAVEVTGDLIDVFQFVEHFRIQPFARLAFKFATDGGDSQRIDAQLHEGRVMADAIGRQCASSRSQVSTFSRMSSWVERP